MDTIVVQHIITSREPIELSNYDEEDVVKFRIYAYSNRKGKLIDALEALYDNLKGSTTFEDYSSYPTPQDIGRIRFSNFITRIEPKYFVSEGDRVYSGFIEFLARLERI